MKEDTETSPFALLASGSAFDPLEDGVRQRVRRFIETILEEELRAVLGRGRYERSAEGARPAIATATASGRSSARSAPRR